LTSQSEKHDEPRVSTFCGITVDSGGESENRSECMHFKREFNFNEINQRNSEDEKHNEQTISTSCGRRIHSNDESENGFE
jgi:hypothetical protein